MATLASYITNWKWKHRLGAFFYNFFFFFFNYLVSKVWQCFFYKIRSNYTLKQPLIKSIRIFIHYSFDDVSFFTNNLETIVSRVMTNVASSSLFWNRWVRVGRILVNKCCEVLAFWNRWVRVGYMYTNYQGFSKLKNQNPSFFWNWKY
jgi:hypothetical protein